MSSARHKIGLIVFALIILFLYVTSWVVLTKNNLDFNSTEGFADAAKVYLGFLGNGFQNLKALAGRAIDMDWTSTNGTLFNKTDIKPTKK